MFDATKASAEAEADHPPFEFVGLDGTTHQLPNPMLLTEAQWRHIRQGRDVFDLLDTIAPAAADAIGDMPVWLSRKLGEAWLGHAPSDNTSSDTTS